MAFLNLLITFKFLILISPADSLQFIYLASFGMSVSFNFS